MGVCPARRVHVHRAWHCRQSPAEAPGLQVFPGHSASAGVGDLLKVGSTGKRAVLWGTGRASSSPDTSPGTLRTWPDTQGWGTLARGRLVVGGPPCTYAGPPLGPNSQSKLRQRHLLGASPLFLHP